jgi:hypothetical protein
MSDKSDENPGFFDVVFSEHYVDKVNGTIARQVGMAEAAGTSNGFARGFIDGVNYLLELAKDSNAKYADLQQVFDEKFKTGETLVVINNKLKDVLANLPKHNPPKLKDCGITFSNYEKNVQMVDPKPVSTSQKEVKEKKPNPFSIVE